MTQTESKILDTAERLFGEQGYAATSLRHIISEAGVNLAAIHYHFGSKEELLDRLIVRKAGPVNEERMALLDRLEAEAAPGTPTVEQVLGAFLEPPLRRIQKSPSFAKLMGRVYGEGMMPMLGDRHFRGVGIRFFAALKNSLPELSEDQSWMRVQFMIGAMAHTLFALNNPHPQQPQKVDIDALIRELIAFVSGGMRAQAAIVTAIEDKQ